MKQIKDLYPIHFLLKFTKKIFSNILKYSMFWLILLFISKASLAAPFFSEINQENFAEDELNEFSEDDPQIIEEQDEDKNFKNIAKVQVLNKITAISSDLEIEIGQEIKFGRINIVVEKCWKSPPDKRPENKILMKVSEIDNKNENRVIFYGWMFSSSPSISGLEHPIYDIVALSCEESKSTKENEQ